MSGSGGDHRMPIENDIARLKKMVITLTAVITALIALVSIILTGIHTSVGQVKSIRDELRSNKPVTVEQLNTASRQIQDTTKQISNGVDSVAKAVRNVPAATIAVTVPPRKPDTITINNPKQQRALAPTASPTPEPTPTPTRKPPCAPGILAVLCPKG